MDPIYDVIIVGGGPAGLSAALVLGRARQRTLLLDTGQGRNATATSAHGVFTRDGTPPHDLRTIGRSQLEPYGVEIRDLAATSARQSDAGIMVELADGTWLEGRKILLATGLRDESPRISGLTERWGVGVIACPFCHGWEVRDRPLAIYGRGNGWVEHAALVRNWSRDLIVGSDGPADLSEEDRAHLAALEIPLVEEKIVELIGPAPELTGIVLAGGEVLHRETLFMRTKTSQRSDLPAQLGCSFNAHGWIVVDDWGNTGVPNVFAAGDAAGHPNQVAIAAASGARAATWLVRDLVLLPGV